MISKTIGCRATQHFQTKPYDKPSTLEDMENRIELAICKKSFGLPMLVAMKATENLTVPPFSRLVRQSKSPQGWLYHFQWKKQHV